MKKVLPALYVLVFLFAHVNAQDIGYLWDKPLNGSGTATIDEIAADASGNIILFGSFVGEVDFDPDPSGTQVLTSAGLSDIFLAKYTSAGTFVWVRQFGTVNDDKGTGLRADASNNLYVCGYFQGTVDFDPTASPGFDVVSSVGNTRDAFIAKYSSGGVLSWLKTLGNSGSDAAVEIDINANGGIYVTGYFSGTVDFDPDAVATNNLASAGFEDIFVTKYDVNGTYQYAFAAGGGGSDFPTDIASDCCGSFFYLTGKFSNTADFDPNGSASTLTSAGGFDAFVAKYDQGTPASVWAYGLGGTGDESGTVLDFAHPGGDAGTLYVAGTYTSNFDLDPTAGTTLVTHSGGSLEDVFLAQFDASGSFGWGGSFGALDKDIPTGILAFGSGIILSGYFAGTNDLDLGGGVSTMIGDGPSNSFLVYYNELGAIQWGKSLTSWNYATALTASTAIYLAGNNYGMQDYDVGAGQSPYSPPDGVGGFDAFFARYAVMAMEPAQATDLVFSNLTPTSLTGSFTGSGAERYLVLRKTGSAPISLPTDLTNYTVGSTIGDGLVVSFGGVTFTDTGLSPNTNYHYAVYAANDFNYNTAPLRNSTYTALPAPVALAPTSLMKDGFTANWSAVDGATEYRLDVSKDNFLTYVSIYNNLKILTTTQVVFTGDGASCSESQCVFPGVTYQYRVRAINAGGPSLNSASVSATTLGTPVNLPATSITQTSFTANWEAAASATDYRLDVSVNGFSTNIPGYDNLTVAGTSASVTGLSPGGYYLYRVRASSGSDISYDSKPVSVLLLPGTPSALAATDVGDNYFTANWSASAGATWYRIDVSTDGFATMLNGYNNLLVVGTWTSVLGLLPGTSYSYRIRAENPSGISPNSASVSILTLPAAPVALSATSISGSSFTANWGSSASAVSYRLDVSQDNFTTFLPGFNNLLVSGTSQVVSNLPAVTTWKYRVRAVNSTGASANSNAVTVITTQASEIVFLAVGSTQLTLNYTDGAANMRLLVAKAGSPVDAFPVDGTLYFDNSGQFGAGSELGSGNFVVRRGSGPCNVQGLNPATTYHFRVFEYTEPGNVYNLSTASGNPASRSTLATEPAAQSPGLEFNNQTVNSLLVTILPAAGSPESYLAVRYVNAVPTGAPADGTGYTNENLGNGQIVYVGPAGNFFNPGLTSNTEYTYAIFSFNGSGATSNYLTYSPRIATGLTLPEAPVAKNATNIAQDLFDANWDAPSGTGALTYQIDVATDIAFSVVLKSLTSSTTTVRVNGLSPATDYFYRVRAVNSTGASVNSNIITTRTLSPPVPDPLQINTAPSTQVATPALMVQTVNVTGGTGVASVVMRHRFISGTAFESTPTTGTGSGNYTVTITANMMDELGVEFYFEATDEALTSASSSGHSFLFRSLESATTGIPFTSSFGGTQETYQMFSVPYQLDDKTIATVFAPQGPPDKTKWRLLRYQGGRYLEYPENITNLDLGKGYWFNTTEKTDVPVGTGSVMQATQTSSFSLPLEKGWNQIGNPYPFPIDWGVVKNFPSNSSLGLNSLWTYNGSGYVNTTGFKPWTGGFVFSDNGGTLTIPVASRCTGCRTAAETLPLQIDEPTWQIPLVLELNGMKQMAAFGMHPDAHGSKDAWDEIMVPRFLAYLEMNTHHPEFFAPNFSVDIKPTATTASWPFTVSSSEQSGRATLRWDMTALEGSFSSMALLDSDDGFLIDMKKSGEYTFNWSEGKQLKFMYSRDGLLRPGITVLGNAYPNPFTARVSFPILLDQDQTQVQLVVYDLMGRRVKTITRFNVQAGATTLEWDGFHNGGELEAGVYLYQLIGDQGILASPKRMIKH